MKKLLLTLLCLFAMMAAGTSLKAQEVTIVLNPGWTWISCPMTEAVDFSTALGDFTPMQGDIIQSLWGLATYTNGQWRGTISQFYSGYGYMYKSNRTAPVIVTFNAQQPAPQVVVTTAEPTDITSNSATSGGSITTEAYVFTKGICWATHPEATPMDDDHSENGGGDESFTVEMTELDQNTTYYVRAYAVTQNGIVYGNEVSFNTIVEYEYVDLGLPSGLLWATCNLGADAPEEYGDYYAWGETQPKDNFSWTNYQYCMGSFNTLTKYCNNPDIGYNGFTDDLTTLLPEDDAATANWGDDWRMPTEGEWQELYENTTVTWTTRNGVRGRLFTASNGNSIFMPAAGYCNESVPEAAGIIGDYWTSSLDTDYPSGALSFFFNSSNYYISFCNRLYGRNVRAVYAEPQNTSFIIDATANPVEGGEVSGGGSYLEGAECTLTATASEGYTFTNWTENDEVVSTDATYTFAVNTDRTLVANFTLQSFTVAVSASPSDGGSVSGSGSYNYGQNCTVSATANDGYFFSNWTENNEVVSTDVTYTFNVNSDRTLAANFALQSFIVDVSASPSNGGSVSGGGSYINGQSCTISALANPGYIFSNWTENGSVVSTNATYTFTVNADRILVANFSRNVPTGAINGLFTINSNGDQVFFSQGNLQYRASTYTWRFATNQWDYVGTQTPDYYGYVGGTINGSDNQYISNSYSGWIDLFGWGTSGYSHGAVCYHPYDTYGTNAAYYAYGDIIWDLDDKTGKADWGYNPIINGGNQENQWRTLGETEWNYVFNTRTTTSGIRYAKAKVNNVNGIILLPDDWTTSIYTLNNANGGNYSNNTITAYDWTNILEANGAVFLPATGYRGGTSVNYVNNIGYYWSASTANSERACNIRFNNSVVQSSTMEERCLGLSVRLVRNAQ